MQRYVTELRETGLSALVELLQGFLLPLQLLRELRERRCAVAPFREGLVELVEVLLLVGALLQVGRAGVALDGDPADLAYTSFLTLGIDVESHACRSLVNLCSLALRRTVQRVSRPCRPCCNGPSRGPRPSSGASSGPR